jgi:hypothetical protein
MLESDPIENICFNKKNKSYIGFDSCADMIVFHHIPKNAGTSLRAYAEKIIPREVFFWSNEVPINIKGDFGCFEIHNFEDVYNLSRQRLSRDSFIKEIQCVFASIKFMGGHFTYNDFIGFSKFIGIDLNPIHVFIVRDPFERICSYWEYCQRTIGHPYKTEMSFSDALKSRHVFFESVVSEQNYYIGGDGLWLSSLNVINNSRCIIATAATIKQLFQFVSKHFGAPSFIDAANIKVNDNKNTNFMNSYEQFRFDVIEKSGDDHILYNFIVENGGFFCNL